MAQITIEEPIRTEPRTSGERLFEEYLSSQGMMNFEYEKERDGKNRKINYTLDLDREYLFEVKDFSSTEIPPGGAFDPHERLRNKIGELRAQFREYKEWPCCGVFIATMRISLI